MIQAHDGREGLLAVSERAEAAVLSALDGCADLAAMRPLVVVTHANVSRSAGLQKRSGRTWPARSPSVASLYAATVELQEGRRAVPIWLCGCKLHSATEGRRREQWDGSQRLLHDEHSQKYWRVGHWGCRWTERHRVDVQRQRERRDERRADLKQQRIEQQRKRRSRYG